MHTLHIVAETRRPEIDRPSPVSSGKSLGARRSSVVRPPEPGLSAQYEERARFTGRSHIGVHIGHEVHLRVP